MVFAPIFTNSFSKALLIPCLTVWIILPCTGSPVSPKPKYEIWDSKKVSLKRTPDSLSFSAYLAWPQEVADDARITIRRTEAGLVFSTDWFPEEEFDLKPYESREGGGIILMSKFLREIFYSPAGGV